MRTTTDVPRVLTPARALEAGVTRARCRTELSRGNWTRLAPGLIFTRPDEPSRLDWAVAGVLIGGAGSGLTGWDAARLYGTGDREPPGPQVVVATVRGGNRLIGQVRLSRSSRPFGTNRLAGIDPIAPYLPYVDAARAVTDAALRECSLPRTQALVSRALQRRVCRLEDLVREYGDAPRRGSGFLRTALQDATDGARSAAESVALRKLKKARIPDFELNVPVVIAGQLGFELDVLIRALRLVLEIDGREYHFGQAEWLATMARHTELTGRGLAVAHFAPSEVLRDDWVGRVERLAMARAAELGVRYEPGRLVRGRPALTFDA